MASFLTKWFGAPADRKASRAGALIAHLAMGVARFVPRERIELTRAGYERNPIVYRSVRMIAEAVASVPWRLYSGREEHIEHPLLTLLARPNPFESGPDFIEALVSNLLLYGNAFVEAAQIGGAPREFYALRPDRTSLQPGPKGWPSAYDYTAGGETVTYPVPVSGFSPILHLKQFHPLDDFYGFAPLRAAQGPLDIHNAASAWNRSLLENAARPSGALVYAGPEGATLTDEQFDRLKAELEESFSGARNAGRPLLLEGGLDWKMLSLTPKDMDFVEAKAAAARDIALALGVPPLVLGLPGDNTFSNYQEANRAFWRQTVIPMIGRLQKSFAVWVAPVWGPLAIDYDVDRIDALASERATEWTRIGAADFLTRDEKREAVGYGRAPSA